MFAFLANKKYALLAAIAVLVILYFAYRFGASWICGWSSGSAGGKRRRRRGRSSSDDDDDDDGGDSDDEDDANLGDDEECARSDSGSSSGSGSSGSGSRKISADMKNKLDFIKRIGQGSP